MYELRKLWEKKEKIDWYGLNKSWRVIIEINVEGKIGSEKRRKNVYTKFKNMKIASICIQGDL